ncbi:MAG: D-tagatose-bisphosphate aldolase, class II, non-catalytic subunit [Woeseiaceae bacterium]
MSLMLEVVQKHKSGENVGICSVCSAHPLVIEAALRRAKCDGTPALIESTSNQVNQDGGYTGMVPGDFRDLVHRLADASGLARGDVVLGGDHLGPNCWQSLPAAEAMQKSEVLIDQYIAAGFRKIHLDCSMACKDDPASLPDAVVASRAARLCAAAENRWRTSGGELPVYIVGTEVPIPGGATENLEELQVTDPSSASDTLRAHRDAFAELGLQSAWERVVGLVVQPGVEFDHDKVVDYRQEKAAALSAVVEREPGVLFEAHSTDYQTPEKLQALVRGHFAILKVGPALTYALREAFWALDQIESEWAGTDDAVLLRRTVLEAMRANPVHWRRYYSSEGARLTLDLQYSLSDRIRYYWPAKNVVAAVSRLMRSLRTSPPPLTLIRQHLPQQYAAIREHEIRNDPEALVLHKIDEVLAQYASACNQGGKWKQ